MLSVFWLQMCVCICVWVEYHKKYEENFQRKCFQVFFCTFIFKYTLQFMFASVHHQQLKTFHPKKLWNHICFCCSRGGSFVNPLSSSDAMKALVSHVCTSQKKNAFQPTFIHVHPSYQSH